MNDITKECELLRQIEKRDKRIDELEIESLKIIKAARVLRQTVMEVRHAQNHGPDWYTRGASGLFMQVMTHLDRADKEIKSIKHVLERQ